MDNKKFSVNDRLKSFRYAYQGLKRVLKSEHNMRIHLLATVGVIALSWIYRISPSEWISVLFAVCMVWMAEIFNTAIEKLADMITEEQNPRIGLVKDIAAAAVLISAMIALIVGLIIFAPKMMDSLA